MLGLHVAPTMTCCLNIQMPDLLPILVLVSDLIFSTRISTTARAAGIDVKLIRDPAKLAGAEGRLLLVDLNLAGAIEAAAAWRAGDAQVIGFISHVDAETAVKARAAGIDRVMARSRFVEILPELLGGGIIP
jgi:hypothetical protein